MSGPLRIGARGSGVVGAHAAVSGYAAATLVRLVPAGWRRWLLDAGIVGDELREAEQAIAALHEAAAAWRGEQIAASVVGNTRAQTEGNGNADVPGSGPWIDPNSAARKLDVTPRRVTQLCAEGQLDAVKEHGRWFINPEAVSALRTLKGAS